jgi:DNA-binding NarL/FixJ family response regulator
MRVVVADDSLLVREGLKRLFAEAGIDVCAEAADASELAAIVESTLPDVVIVDIRMPPTHTVEGLQAAADIRTRHPDIAVLVLSQYVDAEYALTLLHEGGEASGYLLKDRITQGDELLDAVRRLAQGETVLDPQLIEQLLARARAGSPIDDLTDRERHVLSLMAEGLTDRGIAQRLWLSPKTVESHVRHILQKLGLPEDRSRNRRVEAVLTYLRS